MRKLHAFLLDRSGAVAVLWMLSMPMLIAGAAVALDFGSIYLDRRDLQAASDSAALSAVLTPSKADEVAADMLARNGFPRAVFRLSRGVHHDDPKLQPDARFEPIATGTDIRLTVEAPSQARFANFFYGASFKIEAVSIAKTTATVSLAAGSRLAAVRGGAVNDALEALIGAKVNLSVADYNALASARVSTGALLNALLPANAVDATLGAVLDRTISARVFVDALAKALTAEGSSASAAIVRRALGSPVGVAATIKPGDFIGIAGDLKTIDVRYPSRNLAANVGVLSLLQAAIDSNGIGNSVGAGLNLPGVANIELKTLIGEGLQKSHPVALGWIGTRVETGQVRLQSKIETSGIVNLLALNNSTLKLPIEAVIAGGSAEIVAAVCNADPAKRSVTVEVKPGLGRIEIGEFGDVDDKSRRLKDIKLSNTLPRAQIVTLLLGSAQVFMHSRVLAADEKGQRFTFTGSEIGSGVYKTATTARPLSTALRTLFADAEVDARVLGLSSGVLSKAVTTLVAPLASSVGLLLDEVLGLAGIRFGEMDVKVDGMSCGGARLVG